jgi:hypothetical protein
MRYERGEVLGLFCGELGIHPTSRVVISPTNAGLRVWDLTVGVEFTFNPRGNTLSMQPKTTPESCTSVFNQADHALLARIGDLRLAPWSEERETLSSELHYRNISYAERRPYSLRLMLFAIPMHLLDRLRTRRPRRLSRRESTLCN